jgi:DNA polymerase
MNPARNDYLDALGIDVWVERNKPAAAMPAAPIAEGPAAVAPAVADVSGFDWDALRNAVSQCTACPLHSTRRQTVFGVGATDAPLLVVGEAPGADEDEQGEPFVGRAGQLLNAMLRAIGLRREQVYIANILKCRPPGNRDPKSEEQATCTPFLSRQIDLLKPRAILALGRISAQWLLQSDLPVGRLRGQPKSLAPWDVPLIVSYHPAYLLRSPAAKAKAWQDLLLIKDLLKTDR